MKNKTQKADYLMQIRGNFSYLKIRHPGTKVQAGKNKLKRSGAASFKDLYLEYK